VVATTGMVEEETIEGGRCHSSMMPIVERVRRKQGHGHRAPARLMARRLDMGVA